MIHQPQLCTMSGALLVMKAAIPKSRCSVNLENARRPPRINKIDCSERRYTRIVKKPCTSTIRVRSGTQQGSAIGRLELACTASAIGEQRMIVRRLGVGMTNRSSGCPKSFTLIIHIPAIMSPIWTVCIDLARMSRVCTKDEVTYISKVTWERMCGERGTRGERYTYERLYAPVVGGKALEVLISLDSGSPVKHPREHDADHDGTEDGTDVNRCRRQGRHGERERRGETPGVCSADDRSLLCDKADQRLSLFRG